MKKSYHNFYQTIEYTFKEEAILETALTHPSLNSRTNDHNNYERLEFLGDKVLSLIIAKYLMEN
ncbi:MAG: ribonuclease III, partial [Alphaproteobacteria bacterium]|nr:ribonuclease III [Alphaproteobacteria bacterium]